VLLDVTLPGRGGIEVLRLLKQERPRVPVLVLSVHPADQYACARCVPARRAT
jgi:DNA-binding NarL/FixJ family response regulator